ncbi:MAG: ribokinase [Acidobacteriia bacterium]|nr:ribokinase [Terriglobia bacterium]
MSIPRITVVGSYATGLTMKVKRLPSTGETVLASGYRVDYGGKGSNQAVGCARLGAEVAFVARIGKDAFGEMALRLYREEGIDIAFVQQTAEHPTGVGFILVEADTGNNCIALDPGANELLSAADIAQCDPALKTAAVVLTQLEIPVAAAEAALSRGRAQGATTILNPAPVRPLPASVLQLVDVLTPNQTEAKVLTGRSPDAVVDPEKVARDLILAGVKQVVMTLGEEGALIVTASSSRYVPAMKMSAVDTTGAGDAFNAGLATALASGESLDSAVEFAVVIGGLAVTKEGVIPSLPKREDVAQFYRQCSLKPPDWLLASGGAQ